MEPRVAILGVGAVPAQPATPGVSYKEMMFQAAQRAYQDAGIEFNEIESFVTCAEDLNEGLSIFDEYTPDQLGAVQKPTFPSCRNIALFLPSVSPALDFSAWRRTRRSGARKRSAFGRCSALRLPALSVCYRKNLSSWCSSRTSW